jgi:hypothetical protein
MKFGYKLGREYSATVEIKPHKPTHSNHAYGTNPKVLYQK